MRIGVYKAEVISTARSTTDLSDREKSQERRRWWVFPTSVWSSVAGEIRGPAGISWPLLSLRILPWGPPSQIFHWQNYAIGSISLYLKN